MAKKDGARYKTTLQYEEQFSGMKATTFMY